MKIFIYKCFLVGACLVPRGVTGLRYVLHDALVLPILEVLRQAKRMKNTAARKERKRIGGFDRLKDSGP